MYLGLNDKVVFITGASRGIGLATARFFLREEARVVITGRDGGILAKARTSLEAEAGLSHVLAVQGDMIEQANIQQAIDKTIATFGGLDTVVANLGSGNTPGGWDATLDDWQSALNANLLGGMALVRVALPHLITRGGGNFIFVSSIAGGESTNAPVTYSAAKAAVQGAMKSLSRMVGTNGVRVNAVAPGNILFPGGRWEEKLRERRKFFEQYIKSEVPLQRFGRPEEIADAIVFLASERASFITGACLVVDGGQTRVC